MKKTFTIFSEASMYIEIDNSNKIWGYLEGIQIDTKKFEGKLSIRKLDIEKLPDKFKVKIMKVDAKGNSNVIEINDINLRDNVELNKLLEFGCTEIVDTSKGIPRSIKKEEKEDTDQ